MYCSHACMCVCLSAAACLHYCTDPDITWGSGRGCPLVAHCWVDLQSVHGLRCYGNTRNAWQSPAVSARPAARTTHAGEDPSPATLSATRPFHFVHTARVLYRERKMLVSTYLYVVIATKPVHRLQIRPTVRN